VVVLCASHPETVMGKSKVVKVGPSTPATQVTWKTVRSGRQSKDKIIKAPPWKKAHIERANDQSPTRAGSSALEHTSFFPDEPVEAYPTTDDPPLRACRLPRNQV